MEDVLDLYHQPYDPTNPVVCFDETSKQLTADVREPIAAVPGREARYDYEYKRKGVRNLFIFFEPLRGWRHLKVTERHATVDWAMCMKQLVDEFYPQAQKVRLVLDNLSVHHLALLYQAFEPNEAKRLISRLELHYTPKHGSWLNMAETEFSTLARQCLNRRIPDAQMLQREVEAWTRSRNDAQSKVNWQFTTSDARTKLKKLYPSYDV
jgi:transposase